MKSISRFRPFLTIALATLLLIVGSIILGLILEKTSLFTTFDKYLYTHINGLQHNSLTDQIFFPFGLWFLPWKIFFMPAFFYFLLFPYLFMLFRKSRNSFIRGVLTLGLGLAIAGLLLFIDSSLVYRERPFTHLPVQNLSSTAKSLLTHVTSYPSGHTRDTMIFAVVIGYFIKFLKKPLIIFAFFIGILRVYSGEHYPTDVLSGLLIGYIIGKIAIYTDQKIFTKKIHDKKSI